MLGGFSLQNSEIDEENYKWVTHGSGCIGVFCIYYGAPFRYSNGLRSGRPRFDPLPTMQDFPLLRNVQTDSVAHPATYLMGTEGTFLGGKATGV
jgi:hypothetical protein